jgi:hypothetical protein
MRLTNAALLFFFAVACQAVQLNNWRFPYYKAGVECGYQGGSPSGMFWDDIGIIPYFGRELWPDSARYRDNYWLLEPSISGNAQTAQTVYIDTAAVEAHYVNDKKQAQLSQEKGSFLSGQALSDFRYKNFCVRHSLAVDSRSKDDIDYRGKTDRAAAGRIEEAYCKFDWKYGFFRLGRLNRNWGPFPDRSLFISNSPHSYDALEVQLFSSRFEFRHLFAALPYATSSIDAEGSTTSRYLTAHALTISLGRYGEIGVFESVLFGRRVGLPDLQLVNPISLYTILDINGEADGNSMLGLQWNIHPAIQNVSVKGQVLLDDFQVDNKGPNDQEPNHWGGDFGVYWNDFLPMKVRHVLSLEYRYLSRWLYTVPPSSTLNGERYTYLGLGLGEPGNDGDRVNVSFLAAGKDKWVASCGASFQRQGENSLWSRWKNISADSLSAPGALGYRTEPAFPSGIVERTFDFYFSLMGYFKSFADVRLKLDNCWIKNKNNERSAGYVYDPTVALSVSLHYSNLFIPMPR